MHVLLVGTPDDLKFKAKILEITSGHRLSAILGVETHELLHPVLVQAGKGEVDAILCSNQSFLKLVLNAQPDYIPPVTNKQPSLDNYAGSLLHLHIPVAGGTTRRVPVLVLNPFAQLVTVSYGKFLFQRYFSKLTKPHKWIKPLPFKWELIDVSNYQSVEDYLRNCDLIGVDSETSKQGLEIDCISYAGWNAKTQECRVYVLPLKTAQLEVYLDNLILARNLNAIPVRKVLQNGMYDSAYFLRWGMPLTSYLWDTKHFFHSWLAELPKDLAYLGAFCIREIRYWKDDGKTGNLKDYYEYCARDSYTTLWSMLAMLAEAPQWAVTNYLIEFPKIFPSLQCGLEGMAVDKELYAIGLKKAEEIEATTLKELQAMVGFPNFNPNSSQQVVRLFHVLGATKLTSSDKANTAKFSALHPLNTRIAGLLRKYRKASKELSTYWVEKKLLHGRVLYVLDPGGTETGRMASQEHSFWCGLQAQNIPPYFRDAVISDPGYFISSVDFPQSEARCVAYKSGDKALLETVNSDRDYHAINVERFFGIPYEQVIDENGKVINVPIRNLSKRTNHGANYNMGDTVMLETMGEENVEQARKLLRLPSLLTLKQICAELLARYAKTYPKVKGEWYDSIKRTISLTKKLVSDLGWTRYCFGDPSKNKQDLNAYVAHVPQNLSVGIINECFHRIWRDIQHGPNNTTDDGRLKLRLKAQIHDEVLFQYLKEHPEIAAKVRELMVYPVEVEDCGGVKREMLIPPPEAPLGITHWGKLK